MKKIIFFFFLLFIGFNHMINAQVKIGGDMSVKANPSSVLELESTNKGLLIPRLTTTQVSGISNPATGLLVYNMDLNVLQINTGTPASPQWANLVVAQGTDNKGAVVLPAGTDAERPSAPATGSIRYNTSSSKFEGYNGSAWVTFN
ncbi:hypothetical protein AGMMS50239_08820 [Bacteroidia bacterium]|nr:hypothetical protein AGMMS50239_08820 [Bacteroidia bacterium]